MLVFHFKEDKGYWMTHVPVLSCRGKDDLCKFEASWNYIVRPYLKIDTWINKQQKKKKTEANVELLITLNLNEIYIKQTAYFFSFSFKAFSLYEKVYWGGKRKWDLLLCSTELSLGGGGKVSVESKVQTLGDKLHLF